jgi:hypothetical protein
MSHEKEQKQDFDNSHHTLRHQGPWGSENNKPKNIRTKFRKKDSALPNIIPVEIVLFCAALKLRIRTADERAG